MAHPTCPFREMTIPLQDDEWEEVEAAHDKWRIRIEYPGAHLEDFIACAVINAAREIQGRHPVRLAKKN